MKGLPARMHRIWSSPALLSFLALTISTLWALYAWDTDASAEPGWTVGHVRFEPFDAAGAPLVAEGVGHYRGALEVRAGGGGVAVVNDVSVEDYVKGISEVPTSWPAEAQKAQAIAARTYALHQAVVRQGGSWRAIGAHLCATAACQVYRGVAKEHSPGASAWIAAVDATRGQVLLHGGQPILAMYSSSNGGLTVPGGPPYLRSVPDPDDAATSPARWRLAISLAELAALAGIPAELVDASQEGDAVILTRQAPDGSQHRHVVSRAELQSRLKASQRAVPSSQFTVRTEGGPDVPAGSRTVVIEGRGRGHGIGLSQYGALGKARRGMGAADILAFYYGGLRPVALPADQLPATIRVAIAPGQAAAAITAPSFFRVLADNGQPLATVATGRWTVVPAGEGRVRVVPPAGYDQPLALTPMGLEPGLSGPGVPALMRVRLSAPAAVTVTAQDPKPDHPPTVLPTQVLNEGEQVIPLPPSTRPGEVAVTLTASAGPDRTATVPFSYRVPGPTSAGLPRSFAAFSSAEGPGRASGVSRQRAAEPGWHVAGMTALVAVLTAAGAWGWARRALGERAQRDQSQAAA